jgi:hypothetical protein
MATLYPAKLAALFAIAAAALVVLACSGGEKEAATSNPGPKAGEGVSVTLYASPT